MTGNKASKLIIDECVKAQGKFRPFHSFHEGQSIIEEEFREFQDAVFGNNPITNNNRENVKKECIHFGAMALRFLIDLIDE